MEGENKRRCREEVQGSHFRLYDVSQPCSLQQIQPKASQTGKSSTHKNRPNKSCFLTDIRLAAKDTLERGTPQYT